MNFLTKQIATLSRKEKIAILFVQNGDYLLSQCVISLLSDICLLNWLNKTSSTEFPNFGPFLLQKCCGSNVEYGNGKLVDINTMGLKLN